MKLPFPLSNVLWARQNAAEEKEIVIRAAEDDDRQAVANLIHFENRSHRHLDWRRPLDWIGYPPYLVAEKNGSLLGAFACPPDPPEVAWLRLFAVSAQWEANAAWEAFWPRVCEALESLGNPIVAAIPLQPWMQDLLDEHGFYCVHKVISLLWQSQPVEPRPCPPQLIVRPMNLQDLPEVAGLDEAAFGPIWRNSQGALEIAFWQSALATVAEWDGQIAGYQISTPGPMGGHLARLAVHPDWQRNGIGYALVQDVLDQFRRKGALHVTVNTQEENYSSIGLYEKAGFRRTGESYPVYQYARRP